MSKKKPAAVTALARAVAEAGDTALYQQVRDVLLRARQHAWRAVNTAMVQAYWQIGRYIVESEQGGETRASYGQAVLASLSARLSAEFGRGYSLVNLKYFRQFYLAFPIGHTVSDQSTGTERAMLELPPLTWSHFRMLLRVDRAEARAWYAREAVEQGWSVRALDRQIGTLYYERLLSSQDKATVQAEAGALIRAHAAPDPRDFIRDPYVLEFLGAQPGAALYEKDVEQGLLDQLHRFLLELGKGFAFVARQRHLRVENEDCFIDLVFYNYVLKCFVLVDLKVGKLAHQDVGQMDMYVRVFDGQMRQSGDNPTLGLILCSERNEAVARYSLLADSEQLFASRYRLWLPTEEELKAELERDRALIEAARAGEGGS